MPTSAEQLRLNGMKGGRPKGSVDKKTLMKLREKKRMDEMIVRKTAPLIRAAMSRALGQIFVYRIDEVYDEDTTRVLKNGEEQVVKGKLRSRKHVRVTDPDEIQEALDKMEGEGHGGDNDEYYYITTKEPDSQTIDMLLSRPYGKAKESIAVEVEHKFSLTDLAKRRDEILDGNPETRVIEHGTSVALPAIHIEQATNEQVIVSAPPANDIVVESHD